VSFTPGAPLRRSFKEDREERKRKKESRQRIRIVAAIAVLAVASAGAYVAYARPDLSAILSGFTHQAAPKPTPKATAATRLLAYHPPKPIGLFGATPTPLPTTTPVPTPTPQPTPTPTPGPKKTPAPRPKPSAAAARTLRPLNLAAVGNSFAQPPTPAPLGTNLPTQPPATPAPATPTPAPAEVYAPQIVVDARFATRIQPDYPEIAKEQNATGTATVLVTVGPKGNVISQRLERSAGHPALDQAALAAASRSSFLPPKIDGKPATETYRIVYTFAP